MSKNYIVVGASSGIGFETARLLTDAGHSVYSFSRTTPSLSSHHVEWDVENELPDLADLPTEIHGLVYCPGTINLKPFGRIKKDDFQHDLQVNLFGAIKILQATLPNLKAGHGSVVLFSTVAVQTGMPFHSSIAAAKGAVEGLTRSLAAEFAPTLRVNAIAPSLTHTPLGEKLLNTPEKIEAASKRHPLHKVGNPNEMAELAVFLLSEKSSFITGQIIGVDGGIGSLKI